MELGVLLKGILIGMAVSIPFGPMAMLCVNRTLNNGRYSGFFSGLGIATADTFFSIVAAFGIGFIINFIREQASLLQLLGGAMVIFLGARFLVTNPVKKWKQRNTRRNNFLEDFLSVLLFALANPISLFLFVGIYGTLNIVLDSTNYFQIIYLFVGVFTGASLWWFLLSSLVHRLRDHLRLRRMLWINRITGSVLLLLGIVAVFSVILHV